MFRQFRSVAFAQPVRAGAFSAGMTVAVTFFLGIASFGLVLTLFLQLGLGFTPLHAGLTFLPFSLGVLASSGAAARLAPRFGRSVTMAGALIIAAAMASLSVIVDHYGATVTTWELAPSLVAAGLGLGAVIAPLADIVLAGVPQREAGSASGVFNTGLQVGNSIGIAVIGVIFFGLLGSQSGPAATAVTPQLRAGLAAAGLPASHTQPIVTQFGTCLHARLVAADPTVTPPACRPSAVQGGTGQGGAGQVLPAAAHQVLARVGGLAVRRDFAAALARTLWFQVGVFGLAFLLMLALPAGAGRRQEGVAQSPADSEEVLAVRTGSGVTLAQEPQSQGAQSRAAQSRDVQREATA